MRARERVSACFVTVTSAARKAVHVSHVTVMSAVRKAICVLHVTVMGAARKAVCVSPRVLLLHLAQRLDKLQHTAVHHG